MKLDVVLDSAWSRNPFWLKAWFFLFTLFNRKEGKRMVSELIAKKSDLIQKEKEACGQREKLFNELFERAKKEFSEKLSADEINELNTTQPYEYTVSPLQRIEFITDVAKRFDYKLSKINGRVVNIDGFTSNEHFCTAKIVISFPTVTLDNCLIQDLKKN